MKLTILSSPDKQEKNLSNVQGIKYDLDNVSFTSSNGTKMTIPTYEDSGEAVHPDVIYFPEGWNGHKYWMCMTPYPGGNNDYENPSILVSDDGDDWFVPEGLTNPIIPPIETDNDYYSDPSFLYENGILYMYYRASINSKDPSYEIIKVIESKNGVDWENQKDLFTFGQDFYGGANATNPVVLKIEDKYVMYTCNKKEEEDSSFVVQKRTADSPTGDFGDPVDVTITNLPSNRYLWHINVIKLDSTIYMLGVVTPYYDRMLLLKNVDGASDNFDTIAELFTHGDDDAVDSWIYQGSMVPKIINGVLEFDLYYSGREDADNVWSLIKTEIVQDGE